MLPCMYHVFGCTCQNNDCYSNSNNNSKSTNNVFNNNNNDNNNNDNDNDNNSGAAPQGSRQGSWKAAHRCSRPGERLHDRKDF